MPVSYCFSDEGANGFHALRPGKTNGSKMRRGGYYDFSLRRRQSSFCRAGVVRLFPAAGDDRGNGAVGCWHEKRSSLINSITDPPGIVNAIRRSMCQVGVGNFFPCDTYGYLSCIFSDLTQRFERGHLFQPSDIRKRRRMFRNVPMPMEESVK